MATYDAPRSEVITNLQESIGGYLAQQILNALNEGGQGQDDDLSIQTAWKPGDDVAAGTDVLIAEPGSPRCCLRHWGGRWSPTNSPSNSSIATRRAATCNSARSASGGAFADALLSEAKTGDPDGVTGRQDCPPIACPHRTLDELGLALAVATVKGLAAAKDDGFEPVQMLWPMSLELGQSHRARSRSEAGMHGPAPP